MFGVSKNSNRISFPLYSFLLLIYCEVRKQHVKTLIRVSHDGAWIDCFEQPQQEKIEKFEFPSILIF